MLRKAKKQYYSAKIVQQSGDIKQVWKLVREVTGIGEKKRIAPDNPTTNTADNFNNFLPMLVTTFLLNLKQILYILAKTKYLRKTFSLQA